MAQDVLIVGAGHAAGQLVTTLRQKRFAGRITLVGEEPYYPYQRPPLSKKFLAGELASERLYIKPASYYDDDQISVQLETRVDRIDRGARQVTTAAGDTIDYDKLVLATGARARRLSIPGCNLDGVHFLRSIADVEQIKASMSKGKRLVIIGAGYIGLEVAAVCRQLGLDVTVVEMADRVMSRVVSSHVSDYFELQHTSHGVTFLLSTGVAAFEGRRRVRAVVTGENRTIPADFVVVGIGVIPNTELAEDAGLEVENGIVVDDRCQTADADIYAVGDCTSHPSTIYDRQLRLESVHNALEQAKTAANNICGIESHYSQVPWFWSDQYELKLQIAGLSAGYDQVVLRGEPATGSFSCVYLQDGSMIAVDAINSPRDFMQSKALIASRAICDAKRLSNTDVALKDLML